MDIGAQKTCQCVDLGVLRISLGSGEKRLEDETVDRHEPPTRPFGRPGNYTVDKSGHAKRV